MTSRSLRRALPALAGLLFAISATAQVVVANLPAGATPASVAVNPVTNRTYVANQAAGTVTVIENATHATSTITVGSSPVAIAVNPRTNRVYVANSGSDTVTLIDGITHEVLATIPTGSQPRAIAVNAATDRIYTANFGGASITVITGFVNGFGDYSALDLPVGTNPTAVAVNPVTNRIYVANSGSNNVSVVNPTTGATVTVPAGMAPAGIAVNPVTDKVYVANFTSGDVTVINGATNATTTLAVGAGPSAIAVHPTSSRVYVANQNSNSITVIEADTVQATVAVGTRPVAISINSPTNRIFVANQDSANVSVIDGITHAMLTLATGALPRSITVNPVTNRAYVANSGSGNVTVIDATMYAATTTSGIGLGPMGLAVDPFSNRIFVLNRSNGVAVVDGVTGAKLPATVTTGTDPSAIAYNPATNWVFVANENSNSVTAFNGADLTPDTVPVGTRPYAIGINPVTNLIYVANFITNDVTVIEGASRTTVTVPVGPRPRAVAVNPVTNKIYVANQDGFSVTVIDGLSRTTTTVTVDGSPMALAVNAATNKIYVACTGGIGTVIDGVTHATTPIATGMFSSAVGVNAATNRIYFVNQVSNNVTVVNGATNATATVAVGSGPMGLTIDAIHDKVYVANTLSDTVTVIDGVTNAVTTLAAGLAPRAVAVNAVTNKLFIASETSNSVTMVAMSGVSFASHAPNLPIGAFTSSDHYDLSVPIGGAYSPNDPPVLAVYSRVGDANGIHSVSGIQAPFLVSLAGLTPGLNYVSVFALDAMAGTSINTSGGGVGGTGSLTGVPRVLALQFTPPYIATVSLPGGTYSLSYSTFVSAAGPYLPLSFSITQGAVPPGLVLVAGTGELAGNPTAAGSFDFTAAATDVYGGVAKRAFSVTIAKLGQSIDFPAVADRPFAVPPFTLFALLGISGNPVVFASATPAVCSTSGTNGAQLTMLDYGVCTVTANLAGGPNHTAAAQATRSFTITSSGAPGRPAIGAAVAGNGSISVAFAVPASAGASAILDYTATCGPRSATGTSSPIVVTGLVNGTAYICTVVARNASGAGPASTSSNLATPAAPDVARLVGISTRLQVLTGDNVLIGGFIIGGSTPKKIVINARGPSLTGQGVAGALANPTLTLVPASGPAIVNDDWQSASNAAEISALGLAPPSPLESSILVTLDPGAYTAIVNGVGGGTGVGIVEVFEVDHPEIPLTGISTRGRVQTGDGVMIGGFIIQGNVPQTVVVRARGPSLTAQGVAGALQNPTLTLVPSSGPAITNDDWGTAANAAALSASGFAPADPRESAILITLDPGAYTAIVSGVGGAIGVAIVEVYVP